MTNSFGAASGGPARPAPARFALRLQSLRRSIQNRSNCFSHFSDCHPSPFSLCNPSRFLFNAAPTSGFQAKVNGTIDQAHRTLGARSTA